MRFTLQQRLALLVFAILVPLTAVIAYELVHLFGLTRAATVSRVSDSAKVAAVAVGHRVGDLAMTAHMMGTAMTTGGMNAEESHDFMIAAKNDTGDDYALFEPNADLRSSTSSTLSVEAGRYWENFSRNERGGAWRGASIVVPDGQGRQPDHLLVRMSIVEQKTHLGYVVSSVSIDAFSAPLPWRDRLIVTDLKGRALLVGDDVPALNPGDMLVGLEPVRKALAGGFGVASDVEFPRTFGSYALAQSPAGGLTAGCIAPVRQAVTQVAREALLTGAAVIAALALAATAVFRYGRDVTTSIGQLGDATRLVAGGDLESAVPLRTDSNDELAMLAQDFAAMKESLRRAFQDEEKLLEAATRLNQATTIEEIADVSLRYVADLTGAESVALTVFSEDVDMDQRSFGLPPQAAQILSSAAGGVLPSEQLAGSSSMSYVDAGGRPRRLLTVPLIKERLIGRIDVMLSEAKASEYESSQIDLSLSLAQQVATALANAILYERERAIADALQESLLTQPPDAPPLEIGLQYQSASIGMRIGGDFYDFLRPSADRLGIVVGDISGKGIKAARRTALSKGAIRSFALLDPTPALVLEHANRAIYEQLELSAFVTAFYALIDIRARRLTYATAGHPPPLLVAADGSVTHLKPGGPPLGVLDRVPFTLEEASFGPGDELVVFSDGISEARNSDGEFFGDERIEALAREKPAEGPKAVALRIAQAAEEFAGCKLLDDLTVVVVRFGGA